ELERSQSNLQLTQTELERSQSNLQLTQTELEQSQSNLQLTQTELERSQSNLQLTQTELERSQSNLQLTQTELERSQSNLQLTQTELERSQCTILAMNTSKFWQMRKIWFKFRRAIGLIDDGSPFQISFLSQVKHLWTVFRIKGFRYCFNKLRQKTSLEFKFDDALLPIIALSDIPQANDVNYQKWLNQNYPTQAALQKMAEGAKLLVYKPTISLIMPVFNTPVRFLREAIESVLNQVYPYWELCIADDSSTDTYVRQILEEYSLKDSRIKVVFRTENGHISRCSNSAIEIATGDFIALLDHDDLLTPDALYEIALVLNKHPEADMIYSDEDKIDENGKLRDPFFKPDWCPDSFLSRMYTCHLGTYRRELVNALGGFRTGYEGSQDYDLVLRLTEKTTQIFHIPKILYHWRIHPQSAASKPDQKPYAVMAAEKALVDALARRGEHGRVTQAGSLVGYYIIRYTIKDYKLVSIIIPTRDLGNTLDNCLTSIFEKTTYPNYEVILIDNGSQEENTANVISKWQQQESSRFQCYQLDIPFNYSKINNYAVTQAKGDYLLFLNNDIEVITPDWMDAMVEQAQRPSIGTVGALLLYPDNTIQHAGVLMGIGGVANHSHKNYPVNSPGYFGQILTVNNYSAVTAACLMCRREIFELVGGFEEELAVAFNDVDLCLNIVEKGYKNIYLPHVMLYHYESKSRGDEDTPAKVARFRKETAYMQKKWKKFIEYDPCYNINLTFKREDYSINA
ncbi:glycosyltransferase, partial [Nostoc sp.]|uniref:glycosyltransferase n=1 Tax=Nostoc sp. TaxID=1180 RepID=UPI002FF96E2D